MDQPTRIMLYNDQKLVDGILTRDDRHREVCQRDTTLGSHIPHVTCLTYGEMRQAQKDTQNALRWMDKAQQQKRAITDPGAIDHRAGQPFGFPSQSLAWGLTGRCHRARAGGDIRVCIVDL